MAMDIDELEDVSDYQVGMTHDIAPLVAGGIMAVLGGVTTWGGQRLADKQKAAEEAAAAKKKSITTLAIVLGSAALIFLVLPRR